MFPGRDPRAPRRSSIIDPACAICSAPASAHCKCEATALETAVLQAEDHEMAATYEEIRAWVKDRARDYILQYFRQLSEPRKTAHSANLDRITAEALYYHNQPPSPRQLAEAEALHRQSIDEDWKASVQRYPEVLRYYFSLVHPSLPADDDPSVKDPPLNGLVSSRKMRRRQPPMAYPGHEGGPPPAPQIPYGASVPPQIRDVPHMGRMNTPGPPPQRRPRPPSGYRYSAPPPPPGPGYTYY